MKVNKIFTYKKKKVTKNFVKYNLAEWFQYFYKKKDKRLNVEFRNVFFDFKLKYAFLDESQVNGKIYNFLGIPNTCGIIDKKKFRKLVTLEKKSKKNRSDIHTLKIKRTKPVKATKTPFFSLKKLLKTDKVDEADENSLSNLWFDDILSASSYQSPPLLKKSPEIEIRLSRFNDDQLPKKPKRYFSSISKWSTIKSPEIEEKTENSPQIETDEIKSSISPSFSAYRNQPIFDINPSQSDKTTETIETPNLSPFKHDPHENPKHTDKICHESDEIISSSSMNDNDTGIMSVEYDPEMYTHHESQNHKDTETDKICHEFDEIISSSTSNDNDTGIMSVEYDPEMYTHHESQNHKDTETDKICHEFDEIISSSISNDNDTGIMSVEYDPEMYTHHESQNHKHTETHKICNEFDEIISSSSSNDNDTGIMSVEYDPEMYTHHKSPKLQEFDQKLENISSSSREYDPALYTAPEDKHNSNSNIILSDEEIEMNLYSKNAPENDDILFAGRLLIDQNKKIITNKYISSNKESLSKTIKHFENNINNDIEVVPKGIFGYLKNHNDELLIKPVSLREIMSVSDEKSVKYQDLLSSSDKSPFKTEPIMSESDISEYESNSPDYKNWATIICSDSDE